MDAVFHYKDTQRIVPSEDWLNLFMDQSFEAAIFDCDGTLVKSSTAHLRTMQRATADQGHTMPAEWYKNRTGLDRHSLFAEFHREFDPDFNVERACDVSIGHFETVAPLITPIREVLSVAEALLRQGIPMSVATNAERKIAEISLKTIGARQFFSTVVSITDKVPPKPAPEMFVRAAEKLKKPSHKILVFEDSPQGVVAAKRANMAVLQVGTK